VPARSPVVEPQPTKVSEPANTSTVAILLFMFGSWNA
jgi:hypothetical protein